MNDPDPRRRDRLEQDHGAAFGMEDGGDIGLARVARATLDDFKTLDYNFLIPVKKVFNASLFRKKAVRWVLLFGLMPLIFFQLHEWFSLTFEQAFWLIEIYFCLFWALYFYSIIQPETAVWHRAIGYALFTVFVGIPVLLMMQKLPIIRDLYASTDSMSFTLRVFGYVFGVGLLEELCKALPLIVFGLRKGKIKGVRDGVFLGLMSGFGFAAAEGVQYTVQATLVAHAFGTVTEQFMQFMFRIMCAPILHGAWAGTVGWFIGVAAVRPGKSWPTIAVGIGLMALLHGMYDVFAGDVLGIALAGLTFVCFMAYLAHGEEQEAPRVIVQHGLESTLTPQPIPPQPSTDKAETV